MKHQQVIGTMSRIWEKAFSLLYFAWIFLIPNTIHSAVTLNHMFTDNMVTHLWAGHVAIYDPEVEAANVTDIRIINKTQTS